MSFYAKIKYYLQCIIIVSYKKIQWLQQLFHFAFTFWSIFATVAFRSRYSPSTIFLHYKLVAIMLMYCLCICSHIYPSVNMHNMNDLGKGKETKQQIFAALQVRTANSPWTACKTLQKPFALTQLTSPSPPTYHVCSNLFWCISIQVKFESDHFMVMSLQLTLDHFIPSVTHLQQEQMQIKLLPYVTFFWEELKEKSFFWLPTFSMLSFGLLSFSCRERVREDLRWCLRTFPSHLPPCVPS